MKQRIHEFKLFGESIEDIVCKVKENPQEYLEIAKWLHKISKMNLEAGRE